MLKDDILRLLKEDEEFRYAVIGLLGLQRLEEAIVRLTYSHTELRGIVARLSDAVSRLIDTQAKIESRLARVEEEQVSIRSRMDRLEEAIARLADIQAKQEERLTKLEEAWIRSEERLAKVEERLVKVEERLEEHDRKFNEIMEELSDLRRINNEHTRILEEHTKILQEHTRILQKYDERLRNIESYMERTSLTLEEEAREVIAYRLKEKGIDMKISNLILPDVEIDIYATDTNLCLIGEAKTRVSATLIDDIDKDIEKLCRDHPDYLRDKVIKVVYGMQVLPDAVDEAKNKGIWLITANKEYTEFVIR